jgi:hypothetical protein
VNIHKGDATKTMAMFTDTIASMPCKDKVVLHVVPGGGHNPFDSPKKTQAETNAAIIDAIAAFVAARTSA